MELLQYNLYLKPYLFQIYEGQRNIIWFSFRSLGVGIKTFHINLINERRADHSHEISCTFLIEGRLLKLLHFLYCPHTYLATLLRPYCDLATTQDAAQSPWTQQGRSEVVARNPRTHKVTDRRRIF